MGARGSVEQRSANGDGGGNAVLREVGARQSSADGDDGRRRESPGDGARLAGHFLLWTYLIEYNGGAQQVSNAII